MTEVMALEAAKHSIRVNALAPGYVLTDVSRLLLESERSADFVKGIPMRRYGEFCGSGRPPAAAGVGRLRLHDRRHIGGRWGPCLRLPVTEGRCNADFGIGS